MYRYYIITIYSVFVYSVILWILLQVQKMLVHPHSEVPVMVLLAAHQATVCLATFPVFQYKKWYYYSQSSHL